MTSPNRGVPDSSRGALAAFFNRRFEFYGRQLRLIPRPVPDGDPPAERAAARAAYEEDRAFASTESNGPAFDYFDELARSGIVGAHWSLSFPEAFLAHRRPYLWTYPMANDRMFAVAGNWYCSRFAGRNAVHAGDPILQASRREVGIVLTEAGWEGTSAQPMVTQLAACGNAAKAVVVHTRGDEGSIWTFLTNAILQMKTSGVTTVTCLCDVVFGGYAMRAATSQGYFPEWLYTGYIANEYTLVVKAFGSPEQLKSLMLILAHPMHRPYADHPSTWALSETTTDTSGPGTSLNQILLDDLYRALLVLASGVQLAGPHLTPETFERGLHQATFPNPPHRIMASAVGFNDRDHSATDDVAEAWFSSSAPSPYPDEGPGAYCYVDHGARRRTGSFPSDDPFFKGECDNGTS